MMLAINFVIIAWVLFPWIRGINRLNAPEAMAAPSPEVQFTD